MSARPPNRSNLRAQDLSGLPTPAAEAIVRELQDRAQEGNTFAREVLARLDSLEATSVGGALEAVYETDTAQALTDSAYTLINFDDLIHRADSVSVATGTSWRLTALEAGWRRISSHVSVFFGTSIAFDLILSVYKNGSHYSRLYRHSGTTRAGTGGWITASGFAFLRLEEGDYIDLRVYHASGASRALEAGQTVNRVFVERVAIP